MRVVNISFDKNELPAEVTLTMSVEDAAWITRHCGKLSAVNTEPAGANPSLSSLYCCLTGMVFNAY